LVPQQHRALPNTGTRREANYMAIGNDQIWVAVIVDVEESGPETDVRLADGRDSGGRRAEKKHPFAEVAVKRVHLVFVVGTPQRRPAAAVVVRGVGAHAAVGDAAF